MTAGTIGAWTKGVRARPARVVAVLALVAGVLGMVLATAQSDGFVRSAFTLAFLFAGPGLALNLFLRLGDATALLLAAPVSLALAAAGAGAMFYLGAWAPGLLYGALLAASTLLVAAEIIRETRHPS